MDIGLTGKGNSGSGRINQASVAVIDTNKFKGAGVVALTTPLINLTPEVHPFLNDSYGAAMNQNVSFGGTPEIIHNGGTSTQWTASTIAGNWNFADSGKISLTNGNNNDAASFAEETPTTINMSNYTTLTGKITLTTYTEAQHSISLVFDLDGIPVGSSINIDDYIDATLVGTEQNFIIPKGHFDITTQSIDGMVITLSRTGGAKPSFTLDDIQWEATGEALVFKTSTPLGTRFHINRLRFALADNISGITTVAGSTEAATNINLSYNKLLGLNSLTNGVVFQRVQDGKVLFSAVIKDIGGFISRASDLKTVISDGTNTMVILEVDLVEPIILDGDEAENYLSFTISDDLSGLLQFTAIARGALEI